MRSVVTVTVTTTIIIVGIANSKREERERESFWLDNGVAVAEKIITVLRSCES
jgi:hypothetical protein